MKVLQLYYKLPFPMNDGGAYAIYQSSLGILSQGIDLKILAMDLLKSREEKFLIPADFISKTKFESIPVDNRIKPWNAFSNLFRKSSYFVERFYEVKYAIRLREILKSEEYDIIQLEHLYLGLYIDVIRKHSQAKIILRPQNVENQLWYTYLSKIKKPLEKLLLSIATKRLESFEKETIMKVDGVMALSEHDAFYFRGQNPKIEIVAIPIGLEKTFFNELNFEKHNKNSPTLFHLGSMDWKPNILGMKWFIREVWPTLKNKYPEILFVIAGKNMPAWFFKQADKNLVVLGKVENSIQFQEDKNILIVPILAGSGIRIKILEGMAVGKTIISTHMGAKGIDYENNKNILIADTAEEFITQISRCMASEELCRSIGKNALLLVSEKYDLKKIGEEMLRFYRKL